MKILILEDNQDKKNKIVELISGTGDIDKVDHSKCFSDFIGKSTREKYDLIIVDLMVPPVDGLDAIDISGNLREIRGPDATNQITPVLALTAFSVIAQDNYEGLNQLDITVLQYKEDDEKWIHAFIEKVASSRPAPHFEFLIFCALDKEAAAYQRLGYQVGQFSNIYGIKYRTIDLDGVKGAIIIPPRMGLVNAAIVCSRAIDLFSPKILAMSGICAGLADKVGIYDIVISEYCYQHDSGKWSDGQFVHEPYAVHLEHSTRLDISNVIESPSFIDDLKEGIEFKSDVEKPLGKNELDFNVMLALTSSGSAVVADSTTLEDIKKAHRKVFAFEMESYALYESCRQALSRPQYFSAKCVVDCGDENKSDEYHRIACLLSAKCTYQLIDKLIRE